MSRRQAREAVAVSGDRATVLLILGVVVVLALVFALVSIAERAKCRTDGEAIGYGSEWRGAGGCYYRLPDGRLVPDEAYRDGAP